MNMMSNRSTNSMPESCPYDDLKCFMHKGPWNQKICDNCVVYIEYCERWAGGHGEIINA
jgi:hypothetical protein